MKRNQSIGVILLFIALGMLVGLTIADNADGIRGNLDYIIVFPLMILFLFISIAGSLLTLRIL